MDSAFFDLFRLPFAFPAASASSARREHKNKLFSFGPVNGALSRNGARE